MKSSEALETVTIYLLSNGFKFTNPSQESYQVSKKLIKGGVQINLHTLPWGSMDIYAVNVDKFETRSLLGSCDRFPLGDIQTKDLHLKVDELLFGIDFSYYTKTYKAV